MLHPLELSRSRSGRRWLRSDVQRFLRASLHPRIGKWMFEEASPEFGGEPGEPAELRL